MESIEPMKKFDGVFTLCSQLDLLMEPSQMFLFILTKRMALTLRLG